MEQLAISTRKHEPRYMHPDVSRRHFSKITFPPIFIWDQVCTFTLTCRYFCAQLLLFVKLRLARNLRYPTRPRPTTLQPLTKPFTRPWDLDFNLHRLKAVHSFKKSPGCKSKKLKEGFLTYIPFSFQLSIK